MIRCLCCLIILFAPCLALAQQASEPPSNTPQVAARVDSISEIRFAGNKTTRPEIFLQEMQVKAGDPVDATLIEQSRQAIMDLGLFKSVRTSLLHEGDRTILLISVKEKYYVLPIPKLNRDADNKFTLGAQLRMDNLAGLNQRLRLTYETERADSADSNSKTSRLEYSYPRLKGSPYGLDMDMARTRIPTETTDAGAQVSYVTEVSSAGINLTRWLRQDFPGIGWRAGGGLVWQQQVQRVSAGMPRNLAEGRGVAFTTLVEYTNVHDYLYSRGGTVYGYSAIFGAPWLGSDSDYTQHQLYFRGYYPVFNRPHSTFDVQFKLGLANSTLYGGKAYALGGSNTLRGYKSGSVAGNAYVLANMEYLTPFYNYYPIRGGVFMDLGNAYPNNDDLDFSGLKTSVGIGLRLKLKSFVKIDLRIDYAYAVGTGESKVYAGTREVF